MFDFSEEMQEVDEESEPRRERATSLSMTRPEDSEQRPRRHTVDIDNEPPDRPFLATPRSAQQQTTRDSLSFRGMAASGDSTSVVATTTATPPQPQTTSLHETDDPSLKGEKIFERSALLSLKTALMSLMLCPLVGHLRELLPPLEATDYIRLWATVPVLLVSVCCFLEASARRRHLLVELLPSLRASFECILLSSTLWFPRLFDLHLHLLRLSLLSSSLLFARCRDNSARTTKKETEAESSPWISFFRDDTSPRQEKTSTTIQLLDLEERGLLTSPEKEILAMDVDCPAQQVLQWTGQILFRTIHQVVNSDATWTAHWEASSKTRVDEHLATAATALRRLIAHSESGLPIGALFYVVNGACLALAFSVALQIISNDTPILSVAADALLLPFLFQLALHFLDDLGRPFKTKDELAFVAHMRRDALGVLAAARKYSSTTASSSSRQTARRRRTSRNDNNMVYANYAQLRESMRRTTSSSNE